MTLVTYQPLRRKLACSVLIILVFLLGRKIPLPYLQDLSINNPLLTLSSMMTGGNLTRLSLFSLGLSPWMYAKLLLRLLSLGQEQDNWLLKQDSYSKGLSLIFSLLQAYFLVSSLVNQASLVFDGLAWLTVFLLTTGSFVLLWLTEVNSRYGIGQASLIILVGMLSGQLQTLGDLSLPSGMSGIIVLVWLMLAIYLGVSLEKTTYPLAVKRLAISHPQFQDYSLPLGVNLGRSMAVLYAHSFLLLGQYALDFGAARFPRLLNWLWWKEAVSLDYPLGISFYAILVVILTLVFAFLNFDSLSFVCNLQKSGDYLLYQNPGRASLAYVNHVLKRISLFTGLLLSLLVSLPWWLALYEPSFFPLAGLTSQALAITGMIRSIQEEVKTICLPLAYGPIFQEKTEG
ncbi:hypothetical protein [Streptococcus cuniculipharyngis]|uniref:Accessory Sec system protein translocase subunit SecY2 n=1 Tax=Streptococcus cuniculipharyngis TaxID=1562651 RepID=A0A5C5SD53_9STRE|nr:hypothetical protein [Streptococcus cuniculipharyngis]TWS98896.1 hypothetical protein FRX57_01465 [Streptococcus cuniculipharyngis]